MTNPAEVLHDSLTRSIETIFFGQASLIQYLTIGLIARGHILLESAPGLGKTLLAKTFSRSLGGTFSRVQCTSDLLPSDIIGLHIYEKSSGEFRWIPGPLFTDILLVDEINRTGPKTQSALLQAMEEGFVSVDGKTYTLPDNFMLIASQNPLEFEGVYPLPESQLDRFLIRITLSYPDAETEMHILKQYGQDENVHKRAIPDPQIVTTEAIQAARDFSDTITVSEPVYRYALSLCQATRSEPSIALGASPRATLALIRAARAHAAISGYDFVRPEDIKAMLIPALAHRIILTPDASLEGHTPESFCQRLLGSIDIPGTKVA